MNSIPPTARVSDAGATTLALSCTFLSRSVDYGPGTEGVAIISPSPAISQAVICDSRNACASTYIRQRGAYLGLGMRSRDLQGTGAMKEEQFNAMMFHLRAMLGLVCLQAAILVGFAWKYL